jgi:hypothetical protein
MPIIPTSVALQPNWKERGCTVCGAPADVIDTSPELLATYGGHNGEGYCAAHAAEYGIDSEDHPHLKRPGPKRSTT